MKIAQIRSTFGINAAFLLIDRPAESFRTGSAPCGPLPTWLLDTSFGTLMPFRLGAYIPLLMRGLGIPDALPSPDTSGDSPQLSIIAL